MTPSRYIAGASLIALCCTPAVIGQQCNVNDSPELLYYFYCDDITWDLQASAGYGYMYDEGEVTATSWCSVAYHDCSGQNHGPQEYKGTESLTSYPDWSNNDVEFYWDIGNQSATTVSGADLALLLLHSDAPESPHSPEQNVGTVCLTPSSRMRKSKGERVRPTVGFR